MNRDIKIQKSWMGSKSNIKCKNVKKILLFLKNNYFGLVISTRDFKMLLQINSHASLKKGGDPAETAAPLDQKAPPCNS